MWRRIIYSIDSQTISYNPQNLRDFMIIWLYYGMIVKRRYAFTFKAYVG